MSKPVRMGPEWWAAYSAAFVAEFGRTVARNGDSFAKAAATRCIDAEVAAAMADNAVAGFAEAVKGGRIALPRKRQTRRG